MEDPLGLEEIPQDIVSISSNPLDFKDPKDFALKDLKFHSYQGAKCYFEFHPRLIVEDGKGIFLHQQWN